MPSETDKFLGQLGSELSTSDPSFLVFFRSLFTGGESVPDLELICRQVLLLKKVTIKEKYLWEYMYSSELSPQLGEMRCVRCRRRWRGFRRRRQRQGALHGQGSQEGDEALAGQVGNCQQEVSEKGKNSFSGDPWTSYLY